MIKATTPATALANTSSLFRVYLGYRFILSAVLLFTFYSGVAKSVIGTGHPMLFFYVSACYLVFCFGSLLSFVSSPQSGIGKRVYLTLFVDVLAQIILIYASNGIGSGLGYLLVITSAMGSVFLRGQLCYAFAAFISISILVESFYLIQHGYENEQREIFSAGILGILIFITAAAFQYFAEKVYISSQEAEEKAKQARALEKIAQNIVTRMQTGIVVVGDENKLELINDSACDMLNIDRGLNESSSKIKDIYVLNALLGETLARNGKESLKKNDLSTNKKDAIKTQSGVGLRISSAELSLEHASKTIFYIENYSKVIQQAQQMKLASLGRLAASIAHEIRNPLGAASHAAQLLKESPTLEEHDARLLEIILGNCERVNEIIENTLALSRRKAPSFELFDIAEWLDEFLHISYSNERECLHLETDEQAALIRFDPSHLRQILTNLIDNAMHHSRRLTGAPWVQLAVVHHANRQAPSLEVRDNGAGVSSGNVSHIFDPFFTTSQEGSGLGLYLSKELAEINHATLSYHRNENSITVFRIDFLHHQRVR